MMSYFHNTSTFFFSLITEILRCSDNISTEKNDMYHIVSVLGLEVDK